MKIEKDMIFYKRMALKIYKCYVVAILDEPNKQVVYKWYGKHKQWWHYEVESLYSFQLSFDYNLYTLKREALKHDKKRP